VTALKLPFADLIRLRMDERGMGLRELCRTIDIDPSFFSKVLAGKRSPPSEEEVLRRIAACLELDAPRVIVSAGRIPGEWRRLLESDALFAQIHRLAAAGTAKPNAYAHPKAAAAPEKKTPPPRRSNWGTAPASRPPRRDFGDELL
jgi:transcriptional regulator with XRE-family HTH domain